MVEVTQADREAAAKFNGYPNWNRVWNATHDRARADTIELAEAFAAHRLAERERCAALCVPVATCNGVGERVIERVIGEAIAQAIRTLLRHTPI